MLNITDIRKEELTKDQIYTIELYVEHYHEKKTIDKYSSQFHFAGEKINPNVTGICGEWACAHHYTNVELWELLKNRPKHVSDRGDGVLADGSIFDVKAGSWRAEPRYSWDNPYFLGLVEDKHLEKTMIKYFVFCTVHPETKVTHIIGYYPRETIMDIARFHKKDEDLGNGFKPYCDGIHLKYTNLLPISGLLSRGFRLQTTP